MRLPVAEIACAALLTVASAASAQQAEFGAVELRLLTGDPPQPVGDDVEVNYVVNRGGSSTKLEDGALHLHRVPGPESRIYVNATGFKPAQVSVQVEPGRTAQLELVLERGGTLSGKVTCEPGPAGGSVILAGVPPGLEDLWPLGTFPLDDEGRFTVSGLDPTLEHCLVVDVPGNFPVEVLEGVEDGAELVVALPTQVVCEVQVRDQAGEPVPGASVSVIHGKPKGYHVRGVRAARTGDDGVAAWRGERSPGLNSLQVGAPGYVPKRVSRSELSRSPVIVTLNTQGQLVEVSGVVLDQDGQPVPGVNLSARVDGNYTSAETGADGRFTLRGCPPDTAISIQIVSEDHAQTAVERHVPPAGLTGEVFRLEPGVTLRVRLTGPHVSGVYAVLLRGGAVNFTKRQLEQGVAEFVRVATGRWRIAVNYKVDGEVRSQRRVVEVTGDEAVEIEVEVE